MSICAVVIFFCVCRCLRRQKLNQKTLKIMIIKKKTRETMNTKCILCYVGNSFFNQSIQGLRVWMKGVWSTLPFLGIHNINKTPAARHHNGSYPTSLADIVSPSVVGKKQYESPLARIKPKYLLCASRDGSTSATLTSLAVPSNLLGTWKILTITLSKLLKMPRDRQKNI